MSPLESHPMLRLGLPKGRMQEEVFSLLAEAGISLKGAERTYRPSISLPHYEVKILKPQNIIDMLHVGSRDIGFAGQDWVEELQADVVEVLNTDFDPVRLVAAVPENFASGASLEGLHKSSGTIIVASEYERLTRHWIKKQGIRATFVRSYGATEVFPPEDADCIVDNTATGSTLRANGLTIIDDLMTSSTRLFANPKVLDDPIKRRMIDDLVLVLRSVIDARQRVMVEVNVAEDKLESLINVLPCMRRPTIAPLHGGTGYAVKAAVTRSELPKVIPMIKSHGGTDIVVTRLSQIVP